MQRAQTIPKSIIQEAFCVRVCVCGHCYWPNGEKYCNHVIAIRAHSRCYETVWMSVVGYIIPAHVDISTDWEIILAKGIEKWKWSGEQGKFRMRCPRRRAEGVWDNSKYANTSTFRSQSGANMKHKDNAVFSHPPTRRMHISFARTRITYLFCVLLPHRTTSHGSHTPRPLHVGVAVSFHISIIAIILYLSHTKYKYGCDRLDFVRCLHEMQVYQLYTRGFASFVPRSGNFCKYLFSLGKTRERENKSRKNWSVSICARITWARLVICATELPTSRPNRYTLHSNISWNIVIPKINWMTGQRDTRIHAHDAAHLNGTNTHGQIICIIRHSHLASMASALMNTNARMEWGIAVTFSDTCKMNWFGW